MNEIARPEPSRLYRWIVLLFISLAQGGNYYIYDSINPLERIFIDKFTYKLGARYTPISKRQDKPDGIAWIIKNHPEVSDGQISKLIGTTRTTIAAIRDRTHWNMANITPKDPVTLGLTTQRELDAAVAKAAKAAGAPAPVDAVLLVRRRPWDW